MTAYEFQPCDKVYHRNLRMTGEFKGLDEQDRSASFVYFPALGETRRITHARLEPAGER